MKTIFKYAAAAVLTGALALAARENLPFKLNAGRQLHDALAEMAQRAGVPPLGRLADTVVLAHERGTPLVEQLQSLASEMRADSRRRLIEMAGKRQVRMLLPVVALILPTALAFAFFPGLMAIRVFVR